MALFGGIFCLLIAALMKPMPLSVLATPKPASPLLQPEPCPYCQSRKAPVWVHGHWQCADCKINIAPCCEGGIGG